LGFEVFSRKKEAWLNNNTFAQNGVFPEIPLFFDALNPPERRATDKHCAA